jgi:hypothetical protein
MGMLVRTLLLVKGLPDDCGRQAGRQAGRQESGEQLRAIGGKAARTPAVKTADLYFAQVQKVHG